MIDIEDDPVPQCVPLDETDGTITSRPVIIIIVVLTGLLLPYMAVLLLKH